MSFLLSLKCQSLHCVLLYKSFFLLGKNFNGHNQWGCSTGADPITDSMIGCKSRVLGTKIQK